MKRHYASQYFCSSSSSTVITMQNLAVVSHTVCAHVGGLKNFRYVGVPPLGIEGVADAIETCDSPCVITPILSL